MVFDKTTNSEKDTYVLKSGNEKTLSIARNVYLVVAIAYVIYGLVGTMQKMVENRIVVSITEKEFSRFTFPSITFCYPYKGNIGKEMKRIVLQFEDEKDTFSVEKLKLAISNHTPEITSFLSSFTQRFNDEDNNHLYDILNNGTLWIRTIPHEWSGACFTYNPQMQSDAGYWYSMFVSPNIQGASGSSDEEKRRNFFNDLKVFLHEPNKHFYFLQEDAPNNIGVDLKWIQLTNKKTRIIVKVNTKRKRSTSERACNNDPSYSFHKCVESYLYRKRGCQFPWNVYIDLPDVPVCKEYFELIDALEKAGTMKSFGSDRDYWTNLERTKRTNNECPQPCNVTSYDLKYEVQEVYGNGDDFDITFKNFVFEHKDEFRSCDFTCVIGELGGNLGFFLGGSLLFILEFILIYLVPKLKIITIHCDRN